jgi:hypothetical protein
MASGTPGGHANPARVYDYLLGGTDNTAADRAAARRLIRAKPGLRANVQANRRFLARAVRYLAAEAGVRQFLDIGTGLPTVCNTHEVAQEAAPTARIVYVDNDPLVVTTARALLTSSPQGEVDYIHADLRFPQIILNRARHVLDFTQPVAIMLLGILYMIEDAQRPWDIVAALTSALPPGGYLAISHPASDILPRQSAAGAEIYKDTTGIAQTNRTRAEVTRFFDGLNLVEPGIVPLNHWRPDKDDDTGATISTWAGLGVHP